LLAPAETLMARYRLNAVLKIAIEKFASVVWSIRVRQQQPVSKISRLFANSTG
jgi:hypothetical protein